MGELGVVIEQEQKDERPVDVVRRSPEVARQSPMPRSPVSRGSLQHEVAARTFTASPLGGHVHSKRLDSLSNAVIGAMASYSLQPSKLGDGLAEAKGLLPRTLAISTYKLLISFLQNHA